MEFLSEKQNDWNSIWRKNLLEIIKIKKKMFLVCNFVIAVLSFDNSGNIPIAPVQDFHTIVSLLISSGIKST